MSDRASVEQQARPLWYRFARVAGTAADVIVTGTLGTIAVLAPDVQTKVAAVATAASTVGIVELGLGWVKNKLEADAIEHQGSGVSPTTSAAISNARAAEALRRSNRTQEDNSRELQGLRIKERQNKPPLEPIE